MAAPGELRLVHVGFYCFDMDLLEKFYCDFLEFTVTDRGFLNRNGHTTPLLFLSRDPGEHHQIVLAGGRPAEIPFNVINQISLKANSLETLQAIHERFRTRYTGDLDTVSHGNAVSFYVRDPEGNRLELYWDTPWYVSQPLAEPVDLRAPTAELMERIERQARALPGFKTRDQWIELMSTKMGIS
jgi:catechol-2,3-dioxygenase